MTTKIKVLYDKLIAAMGVEGLEIPLTAVKFFPKGVEVPQAVKDCMLADITVTSCQATKQSSLGDAVCLTRQNVGCIAASISLGLVGEHEEKPLPGPRIYTDIMKDQAGGELSFTPPSPEEFTQGIVYGCRDAGRPDYALFGKDDTGRFKDVATAKKAVSEMTAIQPANMQAVFFYSQEFDDIDLEPDVVTLSVRPVELARIVQAYSFKTGERIESSMGAVRVVNSDLIVRPYLSQKINISTYCVGARLIAQFEADRLGIGMPFTEFEVIVDAMQESKGGYPFHLYPGAAE
ncbi:MAG: hypothetical protein COB67_09360 [SAR324 cluster bacterium]|uniref:DUF169 domain-containing protein n=1 Tax=SAR324 cluster bacterium TaxID=2024889 RepID=A0A2A4T1U1_9DELT|nr:MAG: hypothetical protein COB67_09360 [SAR324 cluster bacterium]